MAKKSEVQQAFKTPVTAGRKVSTGVAQPVGTVGSVKKAFQPGTSTPVSTPPSTPTSTVTTPSLAGKKTPTGVSQPTAAVGTKFASIPTGGSVGAAVDVPPTGGLGMTGLAAELATGAQPASPPTPEQTYEDAQAAWAAAAQGWAQYDADLAEWNSKPRVWQALNRKLMPQAPTIARPAGNVNDMNTALQWYEPVQASEAFQGSPFYTSPFTGRQGPFKIPEAKWNQQQRLQNVEQTAFTDVEALQRNADLDRTDQLRIAETFIGDQRAATDDARGRVDETFAGAQEGIESARDRSIDVAMDARTVAETNYRNTIARLDQTLADVQRMMTTAMTTLGAKSDEVLNRLFDDTAIQMENARVGLQESTRLEATQALVGLQQRGIPLDHPMAQGLATQLAGKATQAVGNLMLKAQDLYNQRATQVRTDLTKLYADTEQAWGAVAAQTETALASEARLAGEGRELTYTKVADLIGRAESAAEAEKSASRVDRENAHNAIDMLRFSGDVAGAEMLAAATTRTYVPRFPYAAGLLEWSQGQERNAVSDFFGVMNVVTQLTGLCMQQQQAGMEAAAARDAANQGLFGSLFGSGTSAAATLGAAKILA